MSARKTRWLPSQPLVIPPALARELTAKSLLFPHAVRVALLPFVKTTAPPAKQLLVKSLMTRVHPGEAECLALAMEHPGSLLLLDDLGASEMAASSALIYTGTLGCLVEAKKRGLIPALEPVLLELRTKARFWIADHLEERRSELPKGPNPAAGRVSQSRPTALRAFPKILLHLRRRFGRISLI